eukprot:3444953-Amphidinium_carterae.1
MNVLAEACFLLGRSCKILPANVVHPHNIHLGVDAGGRAGRRELGWNPRGLATVSIVHSASNTSKHRDPCSAA